MSTQPVMFTSESVTPGHPDHLCDIISDAIVDQFLLQDQNARIVAECAVSKGVVFIAARFASDAVIDIPEVARSIIREISYDKADFDAEECTVITSLSSLPLEERVVGEAELDHIVAQNQVTVFGFACTHTPDLMPLPITLARQLSNQLFAAYQEGRLPYLSPDGTVQAGVEIVQGQPVRIHSLTLIVSLRAGQAKAPRHLIDDIHTHVLEPVFSRANLPPDKDTRIFIKPQFLRSGPAAHSGMTGRKTARDTYGAYARHSGSALSGKDPLRVDRTGAYAARYVAKNIVAAGLADACEVQLSYAIGQAQPVSTQVDCFGTGQLSDDEMISRINQVFDLRIGAVVQDFDLRHLPGRLPVTLGARLPNSLGSGLTKWTLC